MTSLFGRAVLSALILLFLASIAMSQTKNDNMLWFRMRIGAVSVAHPIKPGSGTVLAHWPAASELLALDSSWEVTDDYVFVPNGFGAARHYAAKRDGETISAEVFVSAHGFPGSVDRLVDIATATTMADPPYDKAPADIHLGEVAVASTDPSHRTLIWTFRGLCLMVETSTGGAVTQEAAQRLQDYVNLHVVDADIADKARPQLVLPAEELIVSPGGTVKVIPSKKPDGLILTAYPNNSSTGVLTQRPDLLVLKALQPGRTEFNVVLYNPATLLCNTGRVVVVSQ
jgi:hypothetical protein